MLLLVGLVIFRSCEQKPPKQLTSVAWTNHTEKAYLASSESFSVLDCHTIQEYTTDGYFFIHEVMILPEAEQWQLTISYNDSTLAYLENEYAKEDAGETGSSASYPSEPFIYILYDENGNVYDSYSYLEGRSTLHSFRKLVFEGVPSEPEALTLAIYRARDIERTGGERLGAAEGSLSPWRWILLKDETTATSERRLGKSDSYVGITEGLKAVPDAVKAESMNESKAE